MLRFTAAAVACLIVAFASAPAAAAPLVWCASDQSYRQTCGGEIARTGARATAPARTLQGYRAASTSRSCLTPDTRAVLERAEARFGVTFPLVSTCRPGARIAGTGRVSEHARGRAVDLLVPRGISKAAVVRWLYANNRGVTMTYRGMAHVHFDTGRYHALACGGCGKRRPSKLAHVQ